MTRTFSGWASLPAYGRLVLTHPRIGGVLHRELERSGASSMFEAAPMSTALQEQPASRLGSFAVGPALIEVQQRLSGTSVLTVSGLPGTSHSGSNGYAYCSPLARSDELDDERTTAHLALIQTLSGPSLMPVLETGIVGPDAFLVEPIMDGDRLSRLLAREHRLPPWQVAQIIEKVAEALNTAHVHEVSHGAVVPAVIQITRDGARLGGFGLAGQGPNVDLQQLAALTFELLTGDVWTSDAAHPTPGAALVERLRAREQGLTERMASVIARGLDSGKTRRYATVLEFSTDLRSAVAESAVDMAAGAWESISRGDIAMATILSDLTETYDPESSELGLLRLRLSGSAMSDFAHMTSSLATSTQSPTQPEPPAMSAREDGTANRPYGDDELRQLFSVPVQAAPQTRGNPWVSFVAVVFGMILILTVLAAVMYSRS